LSIECDILAGMRRNKEGFLFFTRAAEVEVVVSRLNFLQNQDPVVIRLAQPLIVEVYRTTRPARTHRHLRWRLLVSLLTRQEGVKTGRNQQEGKAKEKPTHYCRYRTPASAVLFRLSGAWSANPEKPDVAAPQAQCILARHAGFDAPCVASRVSGGSRSNSLGVAPEPVFPYS